ncbi:hypothetical protein IWX76_000721 [Pedobacter sp. CAN_A7]|uniref:hypothetical protein n=1 Tax=Pedobacter sp. CAN_A7 TaxID=2787722 RepID=UPI0018CA8774
MIELIYFPPPDAQKAYQLIQFHTGEPWNVVEDGELLASIEKLNGTWRSMGDTKLNDLLIQSIGVLIDKQHFNRLPLEIKKHWTEYVQEAIAQGDNQYMVICKPEIDFNRFEKVFRTYIPGLVSDDWEIRFRVYNAEMSSDFEVFVRHKLLI